MKMKMKIKISLVTINCEKFVHLILFLFFMTPQSVNLPALHPPPRLPHPLLPLRFYEAELQLRFLPTYLPT